MESGNDTATEAEREHTYREIRRATSGITVRPGANETASFLLAEMKASFERAVAALASLESKATALLGVVVAAASALGLFGFHGEPARAATPTVLAAMALTIVALVALLWVLRAKDSLSPNLSSYVSGAMMREDNRIGVSLALAEYYGKVRAKVALRYRNESRLLFAAYLGIAAAAVILLFDAASTVHRNDDESHSVRMQQHHDAATQPPKRPTPAPHPRHTAGIHRPQGNS
ncbi:MAG TPA: hypothetical protein VHS78_02090 [Candidatus Elarobacter sp.]|nr:hypothetical protein [Candidatus Elarobacter sp.]